MSSINIHCIAQVLKSIKGYTYWQNQFQWLNMTAIEIIHKADEKIRVFKIEKQTQIDDYTKNQ